jgi:penicillin-binding protein 1A
MWNSSRISSASRRRRAVAARGSRKLGRAGLVVLLLLAFLFSCVAVLAFVGLHAVAAVGSSMPSLQNQQSISMAETTQILASDGTVLAYLYGDQNRTIISSMDVPETLKHAIVAVEDRRFYQHNGVDFAGLIRALVADVKAGKAVQGASTITEQLVGNLYLDRRDTSISRKLKEAALALQYEKRFSKDQIIVQYLNTVYFGSNAYGIETASRTYFNKEPKDLTLAESALLAGLPQSPSGYSPRQHPQEAIARRNEVLLKMREQNYISQADYEQALSTPVQLSPYSPYTQVREPYVVAYARQQLIQMFGQDRVFKGGLRVQTTIDRTYQKMAATAISSLLDRQGDPSAALLSIDPKTGYIRAMVSSSDYDKSKFNLAAQALRQPGSAFKTFCLTAAIEQGIDPYSTYYESQPLTLTYPGATKPWSVHTFSNTYYGSSSVFQATLRSDNAVYAQLGLDVGADKIVDAAHRMGITSLINSDPAIALGGLTYGVTPLEMASAYGTLANSGRHVEPTIIAKVEDSSGKVVWQATPKVTQAISAQVAYAVTQILEQNVQRGTGTKAQIGRPAAGKTGTTTDFADAWFCGYTPDLATAVWMGHPEGKVPMLDVHGINVTGGSFPAEIWAKFMSSAEKPLPVQDFSTPQVPVKYDPSFVSKYAVPPTNSRTSSRTSSTTSSTSTSITVPPVATPTTTGPSTSTTSTTGPSTTLAPGPTTTSF